MRKEVRFPFHIVLTDEEVFFSEPEGVYRLSEETGWWSDETGTIYVWWPYLTSLQKMGILVHELLESWLERLGVPHSYAHGVVSVLERFITLNKPA